jgi:Zn finger protein HypA/HybF involved in hydrogenase expression
MRKQSVLADREKFRLAAETSKSKKEFLIKMGLRAAGGTYKFAEKWSEKHEIPLPVWEGNIKDLQRTDKIPDELVFCVDSEFSNRTALKKRLISLGIEYRCAGPDCIISDTWLGAPISLQLDHINGIYNDNRLENLRFLCPNCHSQTDTYAGKKTRIEKIDRRKQPQMARRKIDWPPVDEVKSLIKCHGYRGTSRKLGVSDNAVRKYVVRYG